MRPSFFLLSAVLVILFSQSCRTTGNINIPVQLPPAVVLPDHVQSVAIVNRSLPSGANGSKVINVIEGVITGEGIKEDKNGSVACIRGAETQLAMDKLVTVQVLDTVLAGGTGTGTMPMPLSSNEVSKICKSVGKDALLVLEVFDTDQGGSNTGHAIQQVINISQSRQVQPLPPSNSQVRVKMAWRLYDGKGNAIIDEIRMDDYFGVNSYNNFGLPDPGEFAKRDAIQQSGYHAGRAYGDRMFPSWTKVRRTYYRRRGPQMRQATRYAEMNDFDRAREIWMELTSHRKRKIAGRASYNVAVGFEIEGDYGSALEWAQSAYADHREKRAKDYARMLNRQF